MKKESKKNEIVTSKKQEKIPDATVEPVVSAKDEKLNFKFTKPVRLAVLAVLVLCMVSFMGIKIANVLGKEYESPIHDYYNGLEKLDVDKMLDAYPEAMRSSKKARLEDMIRFVKDLTEGSFTIDYSISKEEKLTELECKDLQKSMKDEYNEDYSIKKGYYVTVESTLKYKDTESITKAKMKVIQIGWNWYIVE